MSTVVATPEAPRSEARAARSERIRLLARSPLVIAGAIVVAFWVFCALFPGVVCPYNPIFDNNFPPNEHPSWAHPFGTDTNGRDILSRVLAGSRAILQISVLATLIGTVLGTSLGLLTGYLRGVVDDVTSRFIDAILSLPLIITAIFVVTAVGNSGRWVVTLIIGLIFTPVIARTVRAGVLAEAELDYVQAAKLRGERRQYIMFSEILPNVMSLVVVEFTVRLGYAIFAIATLGFLGFGVAPPSPDWAAQIYQYYTLIDPYWWMTLFPALAIASLVVAVNLVADGVREAYER
ncbi:MAG TPA: ABC transporter permease [Gaiellaceae bacterium]|jgi:peptide/nickel transport system permease protein|nr:ABC transporter permease [Gaiellaceae bacterium]